MRECDGKFRSIKNASVCARNESTHARMCVYVYKRVIPLFTTCLFAQGNKLWVTRQRKDLRCSNNNPLSLSLSLQTAQRINQLYTSVRPALIEMRTIHKRDGQIFAELRRLCSGNLVGSDCGGCTCESLFSRSDSTKAKWASPVCLAPNGPRFN